MKLSDFDYYLPKELIAQYPLRERDNAKLLIVDRKKKTIGHAVFKDIASYFNKGDLLVLNDTKVSACRLIGRRITGGRVEVLLLKRNEGLQFEAMIKPARVKLEEEIFFNGGSVRAKVLGRQKLEFNAKTPEDVYKLGVMPLPPYIKREVEGLDFEHYQTIYARNEGAVASPTAGLHFTKGLLSCIKEKGIDIAFVTLHVGIGTFKPVICEDITCHKMEAESFEISDSVCKQIDKAKKSGKRIMAVGTTSLRTLETYAKGKRSGSTDLFIYPGYDFKIADSLITNFHLPKTTLFMLVCAFAGNELIKKAYQEAIDKKYRFYSYGDAMVIL